MATVIEADGLSTDVVAVGSVVHVKDEKTGKSARYTIVGSAEAKPAENKLSNESPVGRALLGHRRNEIVSVQVPRGPARKLKITKIDVGAEVEVLAARAASAARPLRACRRTRTRGWAAGCVAPRALRRPKWRLGQ